MLSGSLFAMATEDKPLLISEAPASELFDVVVEGDVFTLTLEENPSTGYAWIYKLSDLDMVKLLSDETVADESGMPGAPGKRVLKFEVLKDGVSTILFSYERSFEENSAIETLDILVYRNDGKVIVEENQIITIQDKIDEIDTDKLVYVDGQALELDVKPEIIDGIMMVPLALPLRALGFEVVWNPEDRSIEITKGPIYTSVKIESNEYFQGKKAVEALSAAPMIKDNRTMVPIEFFSKILGLNLNVESGNINLSNQAQTSYTGSIKEITYDETGSSQITLSLGQYEGTEEEEIIILHVGPFFTYVQGDIEVGDQIIAFTSDVTTMSMPPQTSAYVIYKLPVSE